MPLISIAFSTLLLISLKKKRFQFWLFFSLHLNQHSSHTRFKRIKTNANAGRTWRCPVGGAWEEQQEKRNGSSSASQTRKMARHVALRHFFPLYYLLCTRTDRAEQSRAEQRTEPRFRRWRFQSGSNCTRTRSHLPTTNRHGKTVRAPPTSSWIRLNFAIVKPKFSSHCYKVKVHAFRPSWPSKCSAVQGCACVRVIPTRGTIASFVPSLFLCWVRTKIN